MARRRDPRLKLIAIRLYRSDIETFKRAARRARSGPSNSYQYLIRQTVAREAALIHRGLITEN